MDSKFDLIQQLGNATCNGATSFLTNYQACSAAEAWNFGAIVFASAFAVLMVQLIRARRETRRSENYYW